MSDDNKWEQHNVVDGYAVDRNGYARDGTQPTGGRITSSPSSNSSSSGSSGSGAAAGGSGIVGLAIIIFIWIKVAEFLEKNWVSVVIIAGIAVVCAIISFVFKAKYYKSGLKIFITVLVSCLLIFGVIYLGPMQHDGNFNRWSGGANVSVKEHVVIRNYAYVNSASLNLRSGPSSSHEIITSLQNGAQVEIIEDSELWWKIKVDDAEGYVNSEYLIR